MGSLLSLLCGDSERIRNIKKHEDNTQKPTKICVTKESSSGIDIELGSHTTSKMKRCVQEKHCEKDNFGCKVPRVTLNENSRSLQSSASINKSQQGSFVCEGSSVDADSDEHEDTIETEPSLSMDGQNIIDTVIEKSDLSTDSNFESSDFDDQFSINELPTSVLLQILQHLSLQDLIKRAAIVCKRWHELCFDPDLWQTVPLKGQMKVNDFILERFTSYSGSIQFLDLTDVRLISSEGLKNTLSYCVNLRKLYLTRCMHLSDTAFSAVGEHCPNMRQLKLDCCSALTDRALEKIGTGCPRLEKLWLNQCSGVRDPGVVAIARGCPRLKLLTLEQCRDITDAVLEPLAAGCRELESLGFMSNNLTSRGIRHLAKCNNLRVLEMTQMEGIDDDCVLHVVAACPRLRTLNVSLCTRVTDKAVRYIAEHAVSMRALYLVACTLTDTALFSLAEFSKTIEKVDVGWCEEITGEGAEAISRSCRNLQYLGLMRCDKVTKETSERLVNAYPQISYSTMWLECERLLAKARLAGYMVA